MSRPDRARLLLGLTARLLPPYRWDWGRAMRAELAGTGVERWPFAVSCARGVLARPATIAALAYRLVPAAVLALALVTASRIGFPLLRAETIGAVLVMASAMLILNSRTVTGPVSGRLASLVRTGAFVFLARTTFEVVDALYREAPSDATGRPDPVTGLILTCTAIGVALQVGFVALTSQRSTVSGRTLAIGFGAGPVAAVAYTVVGLEQPTMPTTYGTVLVAMAVASIGAVVLVVAPRTGRFVRIAGGRGAAGGDGGGPWLGARRPGGLGLDGQGVAGLAAGEPGLAGLVLAGPRGREALFAALSAAAATLLLIGVMIDDVFPALPGWVANNAPPQWVFGPAAPVRLVDPAPSSLLGLILLVAALVVGRPRRRAAVTRLPVDPAQSWATTLTVSGIDGPDLA